MAVLLDPNQDPDDEVPDEVDPELHDEYRRLQAIMRGNGRLEQQLLQQRQKQLQPQPIQMMRVEAFYNFMLGEPSHSAKRLKFEIAFAEDVRTLLNQLLLEP